VMRCITQYRVSLKGCSPSKTGTGIRNQHNSVDCHATSVIPTQQKIPEPHKENDIAIQFHRICVNTILEKIPIYLLFDEIIRVEK
jgi:hypothetical protein